MTLEDFFTLTEMSNGLTAPARVQDLVSIMQKEVCVVKNAGEITRQWSAVASAIAATENKECLELFVQLDGLCFIDSWLKDAQNFVNETSDNVEELIAQLLVAVERLHIDFDKSVSSGIRVTVKSLLENDSSKVQQRARALFDNWEREKINDAISVGCEKPQTIVDDGTRVIENVAGENEQSEPSPENVPLSGGGSGEKCEENVSNNIMLSSRFDVGNSSGVDDTKTSDQNLEHSMVKDGHQLSPLLKSVGEDQNVEPSTYHAETINAIDTCSSANLSHGALDRQTGVPVLESVNCSNHTQEGRSSEKLDSSSSKPLEEKTSSSGTDAGDASDAGSGSDLQRQTDIKDEVSCREKSPSDDASVVISEGKTLMDDSSRPANHSRSSMVLGAKERKYNIDRLHNSSSEHSLECPKDLGTILSKVDLINGDDKQVTDESEDDSESDSEFGERRTVSKDSGVFGKKCDTEFDYGIIDPLEVARQVAIEVEREAQSCSSEKIQESKIREPDSPDSMSAKECQKVESSKKQVLRGMALLTEASIANSEAGPKNEKVKVEPSQGTDLDANVEKGQCDFDLNLEFCSDDIDHVEDPISTCISVVSASKATAAPGMPVAPLEFEGALGWKGSASTSAFRPASPRRVPESTKAVFSGGSGNDSSKKQQQGWLDIDLNVAEGGNDKSAEHFVVKLPLSSALPSGESSIEASSRKSERVELDLNCASEEGEAPSDWRMEGRLFSDRNGHWSQSPSSSSSSKHLSSRNFDLNDQPSFLTNSSDLSYFKKPSQNISASGGIKSANSVVSIMGMKVEVTREDVPQFFPFPNGRTAENTVDLTVARSGGVLGMGSPFLYTPSPAFGYNSIVPGPPIPFSSAMYGTGGPIPYMVDSRGAPMIPQFAGSASAIPPSFAQQPFIISMAGAPVSNGVLPPQSGLDLNTGLILEGGNRDLGGLRQFFTQGQARSMDEHLRTSSQPSTSSLAGEKRKEPDGGWEPYPSKLHPPSWK